MSLSLRGFILASERTKTYAVHVPFSGKVAVFTRASKPNNAMVVFFGCPRPPLFGKRPPGRRRRSYRRPFAVVQSGRVVVSTDDFSRSGVLLPSECREVIGFFSSRFGALLHERCAAALLSVAAGDLSSAHHSGTLSYGLGMRAI